MAVLVRVEDNERWCPPMEAVVGRSPSCTLQIDHPDVSKEHTSLRWTGTGWEVRDLNSRNGTFIAGKRLRPRHTGQLALGTSIRFGASSTWRVEDNGPPQPMAQRIRDRVWAVATTRLLALPSGDAPSVTVYRDEQTGAWRLEQGDAARTAAHGEVVDIDGDMWQLHLPQLSEPTAEPVDPTRSVAAAQLRFRVRAGETSIELLIGPEGAPVDLGARSFHNITLSLARVRVEDMAAARPPDECGWVPQDDLLRELSMNRKHFNVAIYRIRKQFDDAGIVDAERCIERRAATGQLRLGVTRIEIQSG